MSDHQWALLDDVGIIEQGTEEEIRAIWDNPDEIYASIDEGVRQKIVGDLRLIEIHEVMK